MKNKDIIENDFYIFLTNHLNKKINKRKKKNLPKTTRKKRRR